MATKTRPFKLRRQARPFGALVRRLRTHRNLSVRRLAERAGMTSGYLSQVERGKRNPPSRERLRKLASHLHVPAAKLMEIAGYGQVEDQGLSRKLAVDAAFQRVLADPLVRERGIQLPDELTPEAKQLVVQVYSAATNQSL